MDPFRELKQDSSGFRFLSLVAVPSALCRLLRIIETKNAEMYCAVLQEFTDILSGNPLKQEISDVLGATRTPLTRTASDRLSVCLSVQVDLFQQCEVRRCSLQLWTLVLPAIKLSHIRIIISSTNKHHRPHS